MVKFLIEVPHEEEFARSLQSVRPPQPRPSLRGYSNCHPRRDNNLVISPGSPMKEFPRVRRVRDQGSCFRFISLSFSSRILRDIRCMIRNASDGSSWIFRRKSRLSTVSTRT